MGNYEEARKFNCACLLPYTGGKYVLTIHHIVALLMDKEPTNLQAQSLHSLIEKRVARGPFIFSYMLLPPLPWNFFI